ncbi:MAG TPA: bifunctional DNA primase/polymerase [Pseudonocardiaceae bacterium]|nr:bifunctional DNA primase/polymerase [Pseudonocardiaceae bacterium]
MTIALVNHGRWARQDTTVSTRPAAPTPTTRERREWGMATYRTVLRWPVDEDADGVGLRLGCGVSAVEFLASRGHAVIAVLAARGSLGPVLALPGQPVRWVFLTSPDDPGAALSSVAMIGARLRMTGPEALALPPSVTACGPARWIVAPEPGPVALPRLHAVLSAAWQTAG